MKKINLILASTFILAINSAFAGGDIQPVSSVNNDLYTDTYMFNSGVPYPHIGTGISNTVSGKTLLHKRKQFSTSLYFHKGMLTENSQERLQKFVNRTKQYKASRYYISIIGHSAAIKDEVNDLGLDRWSAFWQDIGENKINEEQSIAIINRNILSVHSYLNQKGDISRSRLYTENRLDKDPISTEATSDGRQQNERVDISLLY